MSKKTQKGQGPEIDEHDLPTEPVRYIPATPDMDTVPAPPQQPITLGPFPQNQSYPSSPDAPKFDVYPYRPPLMPQQPMPEPQRPGAGQKGRGQPASGLQMQSRRLPYLGFVPICIGLFFVCIQMLLLTRFVLRLFEIDGGTTWVSTIYALCDIALLPFQTLLPPLQLPEILNARVEPYTLLAVLIYGILSRLIVHILKLILCVPRPASAAVQKAKQP